MNGTETRTHLDDARCADLVLGLLPEAERERVTAHVGTCAACEAMLRAHVRAGERAWADAPERAASRGRVLRMPAGRVLALAAAAAVAAVFVAPRLLFQGDPAPLPSLLPVPGIEVRTREGAAEDPHLTAGLAAYEAHDLATAERELRAASAEGSSETLRRLYLAQVRYARGDAHEALGLLRGIEWRMVPEPWRSSGVALLARALRATGASASADSIEHALRTADPASPIVP